VISDHLPILQVIIPLLAAPLCVVLRQRQLVWALALAVSWTSLACAIGLLVQTMNHGPIVYDVGGWPAPLGIVYQVDPLAALVLLIVTSVAAVVMTYAPRILETEVAKEKHYLFYAAFLLCITGLLGMTITGDIFNVFVFLEISSLSSYALISMGTRRQALMAAYRYLVMGTIGSTFLLIGIGLAYMMTGTLNMIDLAERLPAVESSRTIRTAFAFLTVGISIKLALFPLHVWLPNAYAYAPSVVTAFLAATATKVSCYLLLRIIFTVFGVEFAFGAMQLDSVLVPLALAAIFVASTVAIYQTDVKRLLAYSSVAQIGYLVLGLSFASVTGLTACIVHMFNHAMIKGTLFLAMGCIVMRLGSTNLSDMKGLGRRMPIVMGIFVIGGLNLIGVPLTSGFISKWFLIKAALEKDMWFVAAAALVSSLLAFIYILRVVEVAYFQKPDEGSLPQGQTVEPIPLSMLVPTSIMAAATLVFGVYPALPVTVARRAAEMLLGGGG